MRKRTLAMTGLIALTMLASTRVARAQDSLVVTVPFDFVAGSTKLPAGEYSIKVSGPQQVLFVIQRTSREVVAMLNTNATLATAPQSESKIVFNHYGDRYFLAQVWTAGNPRGRQLLKSEREKEIAQLARVQDQGQVTLVAGLPPSTR
jgi:hypothetical protein